MKRNAREYMKNKRHREYPNMTIGQAKGKEPNGTRRSISKIRSGERAAHAT